MVTVDVIENKEELNMSLNDPTQYNTEDFVILKGRVDSCMQKFGHPCANIHTPLATVSKQLNLYLVFQHDLYLKQL